jgi:hypothetical protein
MSITRSQIARQMYADGALVDPRMANTLEQNKAINNANAEINQAMRSSGGLKSLYDQYGISDADRSRLSGGMASRNMILQNSHREELVKQLAGLQNQNVFYSSYRPPKPPTDMFGILISDHNKYGVGSDPTKVSETDMNAFRQRVLDAQKNYYQKELDLINQDYISSGYPDQARTLEEYMRSIGAYAKGGRAGYAYGGRGYSDYASPSSTTAQIATQLLNEMAPKGEKLAYINNREAELLKRMGGAGVDINKTGIKSYYYDEVGQTMGGTGFQDTSSLTGGSGDGGGGSYDYIPQPTVAKLNTITTPGDGTYVNPNKTVIETLRDSNFLSNFQRKGIDRALADRYAREVQRLAPYVIGDMDKDYYFGDLKTAADLGLKNAPTTLPGGKTDIPGTAEYLAFNTIGLPALGLQSLTNLLDKALAPPATLEGAIATRNKMQGIYDDIGRIGQTQFENKYMNNPPPTIDGGDNQPIRLPIIAEAPSDVESTPSNFDLYAALEGREAMRFGQNSYGYTGAMQRFAEGGRARRGYGLGGIIKSVGKAVKKVLKSDVGKAAVGLASLYYGPKLFGADKGFSSWKDVNFLKSMQDKPLPWILGASAAAGLASSQEEEEDLDQISSREDNSGLKELIATYKPLRFQVKPEYQLAANGGRMGYEEGGNINPADLPMSRESLPTYEDIETGEEVEYPYENKERSSAPDIDAELFQMYLDAIGSGKIPRSTTFDQYKELMGEKASMSPERTMANEGGLMSLGGNEMDLRGGGFVPLGAKEKADDVPARLSKNEFVFTADAVRAAGGGDVDRGANLMYKTMKNLESRVG